jgi:hypothetical protein
MENMRRTISAGSEWMGIRGAPWAISRAANVQVGGKRLISRSQTPLHSRETNR